MNITMDLWNIITFGYRIFTQVEVVKKSSKSPKNRAPKIQKRNEGNDHFWSLSFCPSITKSPFSVTKSPFFVTKSPHQNLLALTVIIFTKKALTPLYELRIQRFLFLRVTSHSIETQFGAHLLNAILISLVT